jgi:hypothetical protein
MARYFLLDRGISITNFHMLAYRVVAYAKESVLEMNRLLVVELLLYTDVIRRGIFKYPVTFARSGMDSKASSRICRHIARPKTRFIKSINISSLRSLRPPCAAMTGPSLQFPRAVARCFSKKALDIGGANKSEIHSLRHCRAENLELPPAREAAFDAPKFVYSVSLHSYATSPVSRPGSRANQNSDLLAILFFFITDFAVPESILCTLRHDRCNS